MHLLDMDDPPFLSKEYSRPSNCKDNPWIEDCMDSNGIPLSTEECYDCHFGKTVFLLCVESLVTGLNFENLKEFFPKRIMLLVQVLCMLLKAQQNNDQFQEQL
jgi:hypothetical protein